MLNGRMLSFGWFLVAAPFPIVYVAEYIVRHISTRNGAWNLLNQFPYSMIGRFSGYFLFSLLFLPVAHLVGRQARVRAGEVLWQKFYVKALVYLATLGQASAPLIICFSLKNSAWEDRLLSPFLAGVFFFGILELVTGILLRSRLLLSHGFGVGASPGLAMLGDSFLPYKVACAILWSIIFVAFSFWVIHGLGGQLTIGRFAIKQIARLFPAMRPTAPESRPA